MDETLKTILTLAGSLIVSIPGILALIMQRRKQSAEVAEVIIKASEVLIKQYERRMAEMQEIADKHEVSMDLLLHKITTLEQELRRRDRLISERDAYIEHLISGIRRLIGQLVAVDKIPIWTPGDFKEYVYDELLNTGNDN